MTTANSKTVGERFSQIVAGIASGPLVAIWNTAPFLNTLFDVDLKEYYLDPTTKLKIQLRFQDQFPGFFCYPGVWADFGALCEPSAFGCEIAWPEDGMPMAQPVIKSMSDVRSLRPIDPNNDGMMPKALNDYRYFWEHLDQKYIDEYGYLDALAAFKIHLFHFGGELALAKASLGRDITLMGNLHPVNLLLNGTPEEIRKEALTCFKQGAPGGRFLLSSAGGMAPHTPLENLQAMALAMTDFRRKGVA